MRDGLTVTFYPDGTRGAEVHYRRGKREGVARAWTHEGKLVVWQRYENDARVEARYF